MKIAIVDDIESDRITLSKMLKDYCDLHKLQVQIDMFSSGENFLQNFTVGTFEIIFLDIYMSEMTGMSVAKKIREQCDMSKIVFITASDAFAVGSYDVDASYYLLKPLTSKKFEKAVDVCLKQLSVDNRYVEVISQRIPICILLKEIFYVDTFHNTIQIHTKSGIIKTYMTFSKFSGFLENSPQFLFCYQGCVINMNYVKSISEYGFIMDNEDQIPIRRKGASAIKKAYLDYVFAKIKKENSEY